MGAAYQKLVDYDLLSHRAVGDLLADAPWRAEARSISSKSPAATRACRSASCRGRQVRHYHGIDLSEPALELAAANLKGLRFRVDLDHRDFVDAMARTARSRPTSPGAACRSTTSTPVHKRRLLTAIRKATRRFLMIYEPARADGEDRNAYLERFVTINKPIWTALTPEEWAQIEHHVRTSRPAGDRGRCGWNSVARRVSPMRAKSLSIRPTSIGCSATTSPERTAPLSAELAFDGLAVAPDLDQPAPALLAGDAQQALGRVDVDAIDGNDPSPRRKPTRCGGRAVGDVG